MYNSVYYCDAGLSHLNKDYLLILLTYLLTKWRGRKFIFGLGGHVEGIRVIFIHGGYRVTAAMKRTIPYFPTT